ncbi:MAG: hypothetical protein ACHQ2Z_09970 [Elusimicrobiota bacterium]
MTRTLRVIAFAMGNGIALLTAIAIFFYWRSNAAAPTPQSLKLINSLTVFSAAASFAAIVVSEFVWKKILAGASAANVNATTQTAFIVRAALREGAALAGCVTLLLAAQDGVLRAYPAYWVDLVPAALFWSFLCLHWPSLENLRGELAEILSPAP